jgi:hypothetical protein
MIIRGQITTPVLLSQDLVRLKKVEKEYMVSRLNTYRGQGELIIQQ